MIPAPIPENEKSRLAELRRLALLDSEHERRFDRLTQIAARVFNVPIVFISLIDENRQWIKSCVGADIRETDRGISFCGHTIIEGKELVIPDATLDPRFHDNPLVLGEPKIRFYAGYPLASGEKNFMVGTLCLIDTTPRIFQNEDIKLLRDLAELVQEEFKNRTRELLMESNEQLNVLLSCGPSGFFDDPCKSDRCHFSPRWKEILGYADSELPNNSETFRRLVHPEDYEIVKAGFTPATPGISPFCIEFRMRHKDGQWVWIESRGIVAADEQMTPTRQLGFITDITERHENKEHLLLMKHCFEKMAEGVLITNAQFAPARLSILQANPSFERLTGYTQAELIGRDHSILNIPFLKESTLMEQLFRDKKPVAFEGVSVRKNGSVLHGSWTISPLPDAEGRLAYFVTTLRELDVTRPLRRKESGTTTPAG
jgi:PAS domain S-box-containing protein